MHEHSEYNKASLQVQLKSNGTKMHVIIVQYLYKLGVQLGYNCHANIPGNTHLLVNLNGLYLQWYILEVASHIQVPVTVQK